MKLSKAFNILHFHRRRVAFTAGALTVYFGTCYHAKNWQNEILRIGIAGSLANVVVECGFHFADTVNIRTKANETYISSANMM